MPGYTRRPEWLKLSPLDPFIMNKMKDLIKKARLHIVCESARCPNRTECFSHDTATFMILGNICTRNCTFCAVQLGKTTSIDNDEPGHIVDVVSKLGLRYVVVTSVTRDDLKDGGASHFAQTIASLHKYDADIIVEVLIPDFRGSVSALKRVIDATPLVISHNIETVPRLYSEVRPEAVYERSVQLLCQAKLMDREIITKSGIMLGLGEKRQEVIEVMNDLRQAGCDIITIGQYLQPSLEHHEVVEYVTEGEFNKYKNIGMELGFTAVVAGPLVRSSYHAAETYSLAREASKSRV